MKTIGALCARKEFSIRTLHFLLFYLSVVFRPQREWNISLIWQYWYIRSENCRWLKLLTFRISLYIHVMKAAWPFSKPHHNKLHLVLYWHTNRTRKETLYPKVTLNNINVYNKIYALKWKNFYVVLPTRIPIKKL